jgi:hypothetical protein
MSRRRGGGGGGAPPPRGGFKSEGDRQKKNNLPDVVNNICKDDKKGFVSVENSLPGLGSGQPGSEPTGFQQSHLRPRHPYS